MVYILHCVTWFVFLLHAYFLAFWLRLIINTCMPNIPDILSFYSTPSATSGTSPISYTDPETVPALVFELKEL